VYVSNGSGSGVWKKVGSTELDSSNVLALSTRIQSFYHPNIRTANKAAYANVQAPGTLIRVSGIIDGSPTEDVTLTITKNGVVNVGSVLISTGSAEGSQFTQAINPNVSFAQGDFIKVLATGGAGGTLTVAASLQFVFNY
jgi:accessory colonization factor AcfC